MALLFSLPPPSSPSSSSPSFSSHCFTISLSSGHQSCRRIRFLPVAATTTTHNRQHSIPLDKSSLAVAEASEEDQLWAAACLHVRSFYDFQASSYGIHDHKRYLAEREFVALKERIAGKREGFKRVSCINATLPLSQLSSSENDLCAAFYFQWRG
ncbi:hypothetical protein E1A91_D08G107100v1 [Gossypium mustelinum]|uniref:Uncharacterized protein n=1 Tax=Gossypium mustelinum TaxID=34275 RepID=A0A5D2TVR9_GOSMU|nr:hypothetical protein E1A91_D08G107100v1 [Gossypium mustelinum]